MMIDTIKYKQHIYDVVGAIHEVHKELGAGLNEYCYQEGFQIQLEENGIPFERELSFHPHYHGKEMSAEYWNRWQSKAEALNSSNNCCLSCSSCR